MKKQLLCTSAIALGVAAAPATAQDWNLDWGGFMSQHAAIIDSDIKLGGANVAGTDYSGLELHQTAEIIFTPSVTLDNGMTFGVNIQFEGQNGFSVDESYISISSDTFGRLDIGAENSAGYKSMVGAPTVTSMWINSPSISTFIPLSASVTVGPATVSTGYGTFRQASLSSYTEVGGNNDVRRISYYTPSFSGFVIGASYARDGNTNAGNNFGAGLDENAMALSNVWDLGVNYSQSFGTTDVSFGARYGEGDLAVGSASTWGVGASVTFSGFTIGGSYAENDNGAANGNGDQEGWSLGMTYDMAGPWAFEALTYQGEIKGGVTATAGGVTVSLADSEYTAYKIGASRDMGPGVDWDIYAVMAESGDSNTLGVEGYAIGTAINLSF